MAGWCSAVGWNCMNSTSATATPARSAIAIPSPVACAGLVVTANSWPAPPVARSVWVGPHLDALAVGVEGDDAAAAPVLDDEVDREPALQQRRRGGACRRRTSARSISAPVAAPPACTTRGIE